MILIDQTIRGDVVDDHMVDSYEQVSCRAEKPGIFTPKEEKAFEAIDNLF